MIKVMVKKAYQNLNLSQNLSLIDHTPDLDLAKRRMISHQIAKMRMKNMKIRIKTHPGKSLQVVEARAVKK